MTIQALLQAAAERLRATWPEREVFLEEIPQQADNCFYLGLSELSQERELGRRQRRTGQFQVLYFRQDRDRVAYWDWAEEMLASFRTLETAAGRLTLNKRRARSDEEGRYQQFLCELSWTYLEKGEEEPMERLTQKEEIR